MKAVSAVLIGVVSVVFMLSGSVQATNLDSFSITNYDVKAELDKDEQDRSKLTVTETITAEFPNYDQNRGLERIFVRDYDGHDTRLNVERVTDSSGNELNYHWSGDALRIGDPDRYVRGTQTYVITYTQRDVTRYYADVDRDEFYWDMIGVDWRVPIRSASVELTLASDLQAATVGEAQCYIGVEGSTSSCSVASEGNVYSATTQNIGAGRGLTMAVGFVPETFAPYEMTIVERLLLVWGIVQLAAIPLAFLAILLISIKFRRTTSRQRELNPIPPEYIPPADLSVTAAARLVPAPRAIMTAQLIDLAVRHYVKVYQTKEKSMFGKGEYEIEIIKAIGELNDEEKEVLIDSFGHEPTVGERLNLKQLRGSAAHYRRTLDNDTKVRSLVRGEYALKSQDETLGRQLRRIALVLAVLGLVALPFLVAALIAFVLSFNSWTLTDKGLAAKRYLLGLKDYIGAAEKERLAMLQSPDGAEKVARVADGTDTASLIKLYERVLPYAILFGQEKQWNQQLGLYYEQVSQQPDWYRGASAFSASNFSDGMSGLSSAVTTVSSSSSSSGGSSGGGSSGGGGGGGGGGGW